MAKSKTQKYKGKALIAADVPEEGRAPSSASPSSVLPANTADSEKTRAITLEKRPAEPIAEPSVKHGMTGKEPERAEYILEETRKELEYIPLNYLG